MIDALAQIGAAIFGIVAIIFIAKKNIAAGFVLGFFHSIYWVIHSVVGKEWEIFIVSVIHLLIWVICMVWFTKDKGSMNEEKLKSVIYLLFAGLVLLFGFVLLNVSSSINLGLVSEEYKFVIDVDPDDFNIYNLMINYNFSSNKGNIYFYVSGQDISKLQNIKLIFPSSIKYTGKELCNKSKCKANRSNSILDISKFSNLEGKFYVNESFEGNLVPNGYFEIDVDNTVKLPGDRFFMNFNLGHYERECNYFVDYGSELEEKSIGPSIKIATIKDKNEGDLFPPGEEFILNTYDSNQKRRKDIFQGIFIGLIVSSVTLFVQFVISICKWNVKKKDNPAKKDVNWDMICNQCNHQWKKRTENPKTCPKCRSKDIKSLNQVYLN